MTGVAAASHRVPDYVLRSIKKNISLVARESDVLSVISLQAVQAHLLFSLSMEMERSTAGAKVFNSCGLAIRMAQSMGLHRENGMKETDLDISHLELRRRTWGGCVIADRWISAMYGLPQMIDLQDCDRLFPSEHQLLPKQEAVDDKSKPFLGNPAMIELSILLGNVLKLVYSPSTHRNSHFIK